VKIKISHPKNTEKVLKAENKKQKSSLPEKVKGTV
jgi:hypothetical protein